MDFLIDFVEKSACFEPVDKLKLVLFASGAKPATFVALKIMPENIGDKFHFERHLKENKIMFSVDRPKSFEEIAKINGNRIIWSLKGTWFGYDLFKDRRHKKMFRQYVSLVRRHKKEKADIVAGKLYGYPACCIRQYLKENNPLWVKDKYSYYEYYKKKHGAERKFPFVVHTPCSVKCRASKILNEKYRQAVKKYAPAFYKEFSKKKVFSTDFIVEGENNFLVSADGQLLWDEKDGHEYNLITAKPYNRHYYMMAYLSRDIAYVKGSVLRGSVAMQYNYADIKINKLKKVIRNIIHVRKFKLLGREY